MAKIYTKSGDHGETGLVGGSRIDKDAPRIEAIGAVDTLNAALGVARAVIVQSVIPDANTIRDPESMHSGSRVKPGMTTEAIDAWLTAVQARLFELGAELASPNGKNATLDGSDVTTLEEQIDAWQQLLPPLTHFILPSGSLVGAQLHLARAFARQAERAVVHLRHQTEVRPVLLTWLNRLSDALFVAARMANREAGVVETIWESKQADS